MCSHLIATNTIECILYSYNIVNIVLAVLYSMLYMIGTYSYTYTGYLKSRKKRRNNKKYYNLFIVKNHLQLFL